MGDSHRGRRRRPERWPGIAGIVAYVLLALAPVLVMLLGPLPPGREPLREFSVALAFSGAAILGLQFGLTARLRRLKDPYGLDVVYHFHREISYVALALVVAHPVLLFVLDPANLALLNVFTAPWRARFAVTAVLALAALIGLSVRRKRVGLGYERWRITHGLLAIAVMALSVAHIELVGHYVSTPWTRMLWIAYPALWVGMVAYVRAVKPMLQLRRPYRVAAVLAEGPGTWTLRIEPQGHRGIRYEAGQFAWLTLGTSPFRYEEHPFSFSSAASAEGGAFEMTVKELGDFTSRIGTTPVGERAYVDGPHGAFTLARHPADEYVMMAGGIGITPVMSILRTAAAEGPLGRMTLFYGANTVEELVFRDEIDRMAERLPLHVVHVVARPPDDWTGERGFITAGIARAHLSAEGLNGEFYVCGPPPMMAAVSRVLAELGIDQRRLHYERFDLV